MPIYDYRCGVCKGIKERYQMSSADAPICCGVPMRKLPTFPALVKMKGEGGYPSRRKFMKGSAPYTTSSTKPWLSYDPSDEKANPMGEKVVD